MQMQTLPPELAIRFLELSAKPYRPTIILELKAEIDGEIRAAELATSITGIIDQDRIEKIVEMKLRLDGLLIAWIKGEIS